jgi:hypothetical protein
VTLYDPSGIVSNKQTGQAITAATATLHHVPGWLPKSGPDDDRPNTCESNLSKPAGTPWSQPAPTELGIIANADVTAIAPRLPYQHTTADGYYGWGVSQGCWYVTVEAAGYESLVSPVVGVPPEVTDLDLALTPLDTPCTPLTDVGIAGPLGVTSTLYIGTLLHLPGRHHAHKFHHTHHLHLVARTADRARDRYRHLSLERAGYVYRHAHGGELRRRGRGHAGVCHRGAGSIHSLPAARAAKPVAGNGVHATDLTGFRKPVRSVFSVKINLFRVYYAR